MTRAKKDFEQFVSRILRVPKEEIDVARKKELEEKRKKRKK
jgi:hypothetical protein